MPSIRLAAQGPTGLAGRMTQISELDVHDDGALREFHDVEVAALRSAFPHQVIRTYESLAMAREPSAYYRRILLVARDAGATVGVADIGLSLVDNQHLAYLDVRVTPERQREGIGRALYDAAAARCREEGRTTVVGEANVASGMADDDGPAYAFAVAMGARSVHEEVHLLLDLPASPPVPPADPEWEIVTWLNHCPPGHVAAYCEMRTQMDNDVPRGDLDYEPHVFDEERLRVQEARLAKLYHQIVAVARRTTDGVLGGYSVVFLPFGETYAHQDDTLVMPAHRGRRLGSRLKLATLEIIQRDHPERAAIHTWTDPGNHAMQSTNHSFGFRLVDRMHEMQSTIVPSRG
jgi:GNAT superfamily N-acetyltransferase